MSPPKSPPDTDTPSAPPTRWRRIQLELPADARLAAEAQERLAELAKAIHPEAEVREIHARQELLWTDLRFLVVDTETTGLDPRKDRVIEVGWVRFARGLHLDQHATLCRFAPPLPDSVQALTGITSESLEFAPAFAHTAPALLRAMASVDFIVAYHATFDRNFLSMELQRLGLSLPDIPWVDPLVFVKELDRYKPGKKLVDATSRWGIAQTESHRALADATATGQLLLRMAPFLPVRTLEDLLEQQSQWDEQQRAERRHRSPARHPPSPASRSNETASEDDRRDEAPADDGRREGP